MTAAAASSGRSQMLHSGCWVLCTEAGRIQGGCTAQHDTQLNTQCSIHQQYSVAALFADI